MQCLCIITAVFVPLKVKAVSCKPQHLCTATLDICSLPNRTMWLLGRHSTTGRTSSAESDRRVMPALKGLPRSSTDQGASRGSVSAMDAMNSLATAPPTVPRRSGMPMRCAVCIFAPNQQQRQRSFLRTSWQPVPLLPWRSKGSKVLSMCFICCVQEPPAPCSAKDVTAEKQAARECAPCGPRHKFHIATVGCSACSFFVRRVDGAGFSQMIILRHCCGNLRPQEPRGREAVCLGFIAQ